MMAMVAMMVTMVVTMVVVTVFFLLLPGQAAAVVWAAGSGATAVATLLV